MRPTYMIVTNCGHCLGEQVSLAEAVRVARIAIKLGGFHSIKIYHLGAIVEWID
jgi:hypothetical protein